MSDTNAPEKKKSSPLFFAVILFVLAAAIGIWFYAQFGMTANEIEMEGVDKQKSRSSAIEPPAAESDDPTTRGSSTQPAAATRP